MKNSIMLPLATIPAFVVTATSLLILLATVVAASKPGDLLYSLRGPAMQIPFLLGNDGVPAKNPVAAPKPASEDEPAPVIRPLNPQTDNAQISSDKSSGTQSSTSGSVDIGSPEIESQRQSGNENQMETETEKESGAVRVDSSNRSSGGSDDSSSSNKGKK